MKQQKEEKQLGGVSQGQINRWKAENKGEVYLVSVPSDKGEAYGYFKKPDLGIIGAASKYASSDPIKSGEIMFNSCWLGGDAALKQDDELKVSCFAKLGELFKIREASIKKL